MASIFGILTGEQARQIRSEFGTPVYVYNQRLLEQYANEALRFPQAYGLTVRYAMKALPTKMVLQLFDQWGLQIDASSGYEVERALHAGIAPRKIQLTAQEIPDNLEELLEQGIQFNACSLWQLETMGKLRPGSSLSIRINPGQGSGVNGKVNVGGSSSSFGIWHESMNDVQQLAAQYKLNIIQFHTHIGSESDLVIWHDAAQYTLGLLKKFPTVKTLNLGGGFKVCRVEEDTGTDLQACGIPLKKAFEEFYEETGRKLQLEIEPGTFLVANAGAVVTTVQDIVSTDQYTFLKIDSGMTEVTRPALYAAQHPLALVPSSPGKVSSTMKEYVVVGHCCETGDLWTPMKGNAEEIKPRALPTAKTGDLLIIGGAGAYCSSMSVKNYCSFPEAPEVLIANNGELKLMRKPQTLRQMLQNEMELS